MQKYFKVPFWFLLIASLIGLMLRYHLVHPLPGLIYSNWLHTHSHLMFLGWLLNFFNLAFVMQYVPDLWETRYKAIFFINQGLLMGMLIFFPIQGYGAVTIPLSTVHTITTIIFCLRFIKDTRQVKTMSRWFATWALIFFVVSSAGPFALAPIMANHLGHSKWYYFAVYFYLHFQYNGFFFFGVIALFLRLMEDERSQAISRRELKIPRRLFVVSILITYLLSVLWAQPGMAFNVIGLVFAFMQLIIFFMIFFMFRNSWTEFKARLLPVPRLLFVLSCIAFAFKLVLQVLSAHPFFVQLTYDMRYIVIAYLHMVLIGGATFFAFGWLCQYRVVSAPSQFVVFLLVFGFIGSEILVASIPMISIIASKGSLLVFTFSAIMFAGIVGFFSRIFHM